MSDKTTNYGLTKPKFGTNPQLAKDLDQIDAAIKAALDAGGGGGGGGFSQAKLTFHDSDISRMNINDTGGLLLLAGVAGKWHIPLFCMLKFHYGGVAYFSGTNFDDLLIYQGQGNPLLRGSTKYFMDGAFFTPHTIQAMRQSDSSTATYAGSFAGGDPLLLATTGGTTLADGDLGTNSNIFEVTLGYLTYDIATGVVS